MSTSLPSVYAVTLNWNGRQDLLECLASLKRQTYPNLHILSVDNHSSDGSPQAVAEYFPEVEQIINPDDLGFGRGLNVGMRKAVENGADFIFTVSNDTLLDPECVSHLVQHAGGDIGLLAPLIFYAGEPQVIWAMGGKTNRWTLEKVSPWDGHPDPGDLPELIEQDFVTGCALMFPRETLERVGYWDETFFMYYEDSDLCRRVRCAGLRILVVPAAKMWHKVASSSGGTATPTERYWMARSSVHYFRKHARGLQIPVVLFWRSSSALRTTGRLARQKKWPALKSYWRGLFEGIKENIA
jgi:GT2 family glycosyltransferase